MFKKVALSAVAMMAIATAANAQTIVLNSAGAGNFNIADQVNPTLTNAANALNWGVTGNNVNGTNFFSFAKFDTTGVAFGLAPGSYSLTSVEFILSGEAELTFTATLTAGDGSIDDGTSLAQIRLLNPSDNTSLVVTTPTLNVTGQDLVLNIPVTVGPTVVTDSDSSGVLSSAAILSAFSTSGLQLVNTPVGARSITNVPTSGSVSTATTGFAKASLEVRYNYTTNTTTGVPEPSAVAFAAIAGAGLVGMMVRARRK